MGEKNHWLFHSLEVSELSIQGHHHSAIRKQPELLKCRRQFILLGIPDKRIQGTSTQCCLHCQLSGSSFTFSFCQNSTNVFGITMYPALEMNPLKKERICFWLTQTVCTYVWIQCAIHVCIEPWEGRILSCTFKLSSYRFSQHPASCLWKQLWGSQLHGPPYFCKSCHLGFVQQKDATSLSFVNLVEQLNSPWQSS